MFSTVERRLLWNNLAVLGGILLAFAVAVYVLFAHSLAVQLDERLMLLAQSVALSVESEDGVLQLSESIYLGSTGEQVVLGDAAVAQWLDVQGRVVRSRGRLTLTRDAPHPNLLTQNTAPPARVYSLAVREPKTGRLLGYVRAALDFASIDDTLARLLWGLAGGIALALVLAAAGSLWLTRQAMRPVQAGYRQLQQFTADASHELRSPLTAIKLNAATALRRPAELSTFEALDSFKQIQAAADQMICLTNDLLLLARADEGLEGYRREVSLDRLLADLVEQMGGDVDAKQIRLDYRAAGYPTVSGHPEQLNRLFHNLIENAIQYTLPGGEIAVVLLEQEHSILVDVSDTGVGIAAEHLERVFDRFWREDKARSRRSGGMGLGLAIALSTARAHGGNITVTSEEHKGSRFVVRLPRAKGTPSLEQ